MCLCTSGGGFTDPQGVRFVSIYVSGNKSLVASALGSQTRGRPLAQSSAKQARAIINAVFEHMGIVDKWAAIDDFMTKFKGNPASSIVMSKFIRTLGRRDRNLGRSVARQLEIFSVTFCRFEVQLAQLRLGCTRRLRALRNPMQELGRLEPQLHTP